MQNLEVYFLSYEKEIRLLKYALFQQVAGSPRTDRAERDPGSLMVRWRSHMQRL